MTTGPDVAAIAQATLAAVVDHYASAGVQLPGRRIIAAGATRGVAWDCDQVVVTCQGLGTGTLAGSGATAKPTGNPSSTLQVPYAIMGVQIVRPHPESEDEGRTPPSARAVTDAGLASMRDVALMTQALMALCGRSGALKDHGTARVLDVVTLGPDGFYSGVEGSFSVTAL